MRLLVTGGAGFIGSNLIHRLLSNETLELLVNLDSLTYSGNAKNLAHLETEKAYRFEKVDLNNGADVARVLGSYQIDHVMHLAAESHVDRSINSPEPFLKTNIMGTFNLLESCRHAWNGDFKDRRFLHVSTDEVYGSLGDDGFFTEANPYKPNSPYAASKASSDLIVRAYGKTYGLPVLLTHCSNNYGPYQFPEKLIPLVILKAIHGKPIPVYGKGTNVRDWIHVDDHARALWQVLKHGKQGETYNIGGNQESSNLELVRQICAILDECHPQSTPGNQGSTPGRHDSLIEFVTDRPGHDFRYAIDNSKIEQSLGWKPSYDLDTGLEQTVKWYLENEGWWQDIMEQRYDLQRLGISTKGTKV